MTLNGTPYEDNTLSVTYPDLINIEDWDFVLAHDEKQKLKFTRMMWENAPLWATKNNNCRKQ